MFKRSFLSLMLVASLACPAVQAATWSEKASELAVSARALAQSNWSSLYGSASTQLKTAKDFTGAIISPSTYAQVVKAAQAAYSDQGFKAASQALVKDKSAIAGVVLVTAALAGIGYAAYNKWFAQKTVPLNTDDFVKIN